MLACTIESLHGRDNVWNKKFNDMRNIITKINHCEISIIGHS